MSVRIILRDDNIEKALKIFKKKLDKSGILKVLKEKRYFEKPSAIKRRKNKEADRKRKQKRKFKK